LNDVAVVIIVRRLDQEQMEGLSCCGLRRGDGKLPMSNRGR
jgi:hypothetical protein